MGAGSRMAADFELTTVQDVIRRDFFCPTCALCISIGGRAVSVALYSEYPISHGASLFLVRTRFSLGFRPSYTSTPGWVSTERGISIKKKKKKKKFAGFFPPLKKKKKKKKKS